MEGKGFDYINMVPFIDVMLVLLTIVLMTSTFVASGIIPLELPRVAGHHEKALKSKVVEIDSAGRLYFQGVPVSLSVLREQIGRESTDTPFLIRADRNLPLQQFVEVIDIIKASGFKKVSLQTERLEK